MKKAPHRRARGPVAKGLEIALANEIDGREFYRMAARSTRDAGVRRMFTFLMEEEERHREAIVDRIARTAEGRPPKAVARKAADRKALGKFRSALFTGDFVSRGRRVEGEAAALSIGMTLERRAIAQFTRLRLTVKGDAEGETFFDDLIAWERDHLDLLARQYEQLRALYWEEARFWPF